MSYDFGHLGLPIIGIDCFGYSNSFAARAFVQYNDAIQKTGLGQDLLRRLNDDSRVTEMSGQLIPCGLHNSAAFDINILAAWWIMRINEIGQSGADAELETYLQSDEVDVIVSQWIVGPNPSKVMSLGEGYDLCPLVEMPDSDSKERYSQAINKQNRLDGPAPRAAICKTIKRKKFMKSNSKEIHSISGETYKKIEDRITILNCISDIFCLPWVKTSHLPSSVPTGILGTSDLSRPMNDFSYQKVADVVDLDTRLVTELLGGLEKLDPNWTRRISLALNRFAIAKATRNLQSSALDLGISLEMVLLAGEGEKSQIRQKFSTRASWLIGSDGNERLGLFKSFQQIYDDRSEVAHNGFSDTLQNRNSKSSGNYLKRHFALAERVFCQIIINGPSTSWEALVLNAQ